MLPSQTLADIRTRMGTGGAAADASGSVGGSSITIGTKCAKGGGGGRRRRRVRADFGEPERSDRGGGGGGGGGGVSQSQRSVAGSSSGAVGSGGGIGGALGGGAAADAMPLAELLESLEQGSLTDELQAERDADLDMNSLEDLELSDPSEIGEVRAKSDAALQLLASQKARIEAELKSRQQLILLLSRSVEQQNAQCQKLKGASRAATPCWQRPARRPSRRRRWKSRWPPSLLQRRKLCERRPAPRACGHLRLGRHLRAVSCNSYWGL